jgi:hypothetical protein
LLKMLREAFRERATLYKLSGSAFELNQNKIKGIMKNLERLGMKISKYDLDRLRDKCNSEIYEETIGELEAINCVIEAQPMSGLEGKRDKLLKLLVRLKEESNLGDKGVSDKALEMIHKQKENLKIIKEAA